MKSNDQFAYDKDPWLKIQDLESDLKRRSLRGGGAIIFSRISTYAIQMISAFILARLLKPEDFGLVALVMVVSMIVVEFGTLRLGDAIVQASSLNHSQVTGLFWLNVGLSLLVTIIFICASPALAWFYGDRRVQSIACVMGVSMIFYGVSVEHLALLQRRMEFSKIALVQIVAAIASATTAISMALFNFSYWALVARQIMLPGALAVGAWTVCGWRPGPPGRPQDVMRMVKFGFNSLGNYLTTYLTRSADKILIGRFCGAYLLGHYERSYHLFVFPVNQLTYPLTSVALATLSKLRNDMLRYKKYYLEAIAILAFVGMPLSGFLWLVAGDIILLLLGPQWREAGEVLRFLAPGIGIFLIYGTNGWLHLSLGRADRWFRWGLGASIATVALFILGIRFGVNGVAIAYSTSFYILIGPGLSYAGRPINLHFYEIFAVFWRYFAAALISAYICWLLQINRVYSMLSLSTMGLVLRIAVLGSCYILVYLCLVVIFFKGWSPISNFVRIVAQLTKDA